MKVTIQNIGDGEEEEIIVRTRRQTPELDTIVARIKFTVEGVTAYRDGEIYKVRLDDVLWFETVENHAFLYLENEVYECRLKLYEFERLTAGSGFFRATKSTVINADKIESVAPTLSGRFIVKFYNGDKAVVSRGYVGDLKKVMGL